MGINKKSKNKSTKQSSKQHSQPSMVRSPEGPRPTPPMIDAVVGFMLRFRKYGRDILGVLLALFAMLIILGLFGLSSGAWLLSWVESLKKWLGWGGSLLLVCSLGVGSLLAFRLSNESFSARDWGKVISIEFASFSFLGLLSVIGGNSVETADKFGGLVGWGLSEFVGMLLSVLPESMIDDSLHKIRLKGVKMERHLGVLLHGSRTLSSPATELLGTLKIRKNYSEIP